MNNKKSLRIGAVSFKRTESSDWEEGVIINEDEMIIDINGKMVQAPVWTYNREYWNGVLVIYSRIK